MQPRKLLALVVLILCLALSACGNTGNPTESPPSILPEATPSIQQGSPVAPTAGTKEPYPPPSTGTPGTPAPGKTPYPAPASGKISPGSSAPVAVAWAAQNLPGTGRLNGRLR